MQQIYTGYDNILSILNKSTNIRPLIVCDSFIRNTFIMKYIDEICSDYIIFDEFTVNPKYEEVVKGINVFKQEHCNLIISIGGGSCIDVAKCINLFSTLDDSINYLEQEYVRCSVEHLAIPTTAGTGSESTRYAVIYYNGIKQSITNSVIIPEYVILEPKFLETLPMYQKKSTILDAFCQAIESYWSINSTDESKLYSKESIELILANIDAYIDGINDVNELILKASNLSGKAINITQTTAAHAMSYKITSMYNISHGHAVAMCLPYVWEYISNNTDKCIDSRGKEYLLTILTELNNIFKVSSSKDAICKFKQIYDKMLLDDTKMSNDNELDKLTDSVNVTRLKNNPVDLNKEEIRAIYSSIF